MTNNERDIKKEKNKTGKSENVSVSVCCFYSILIVMFCFQLIYSFFAFLIFICSSMINLSVRLLFNQRFSY